MFNLGLKEHEKREEEINSFFSSISEARDDNKNQGVKCINDYSEYKKKVGRLMNRRVNRPRVDNKVGGGLLGRCVGVIGGWVG